jgi:hypothetical protein
MGYNADRPFNARPVDYVVMALAVVVSVALVAWAFLG